MPRGNVFGKQSKLIDLPSSLFAFLESGFKYHNKGRDGDEAEILILAYVNIIIS